VSEMNRNHCPTSIETGVRSPSEYAVVRAALDTNQYDTGITVSDEELARLRIDKARFHGDWNYVVHPRS